MPRAQFPHHESLKITINVTFTLAALPPVRCIIHPHSHHHGPDAMLISPPPTSTTTEPEADFAASPIFALMLEQLADALPPLETETPASAARRQEIARAMVIATHPADPIEAALAISAAVAYQATLTCQRPRRRARPDRRPVQPLRPDRHRPAPRLPRRCPGARQAPRRIRSARHAQTRPHLVAPPARTRSSSRTTTPSPICPSSSPATATANRSHCIASAT